MKSYTGHLEPMEGLIEVTVVMNALQTIERRDFKRVGGPKTEVSARLVDCGNRDYVSLDEQRKIIVVGPYRLKILERSIAKQTWSCVRLDYSFWWVLYLAHKVTKLLRTIEGKFIITLAVWGLAKFHYDCEPSWNDVYFVKRVKSFFSKV